MSRAGRRRAAARMPRARRRRAAAACRRRRAGSRERPSSTLTSIIAVNVELDGPNVASSTFRGTGAMTGGSKVPAPRRAPAVPCPLAGGPRRDPERSRRGPTAALVPRSRRPPAPRSGATPRSHLPAGRIASRVELAASGRSSSTLSSIIAVNVELAAGAAATPTREPPPLTPERRHGDAGAPPRDAGAPPTGSAAKARPERRRSTTAVTPRRGETPALHRFVRS